MRNVKYTDSVTFRCLEHLRETSLDISLIHAGGVYPALRIFRKRLLLNKRQYLSALSRANVRHIPGQGYHIWL